jgi:hypothetical protein
MNSYKVTMLYTRAYTVWVEAESEEMARSHARYKNTPDDCSADPYAEWEVYDVKQLETTS